MKFILVRQSHLGGFYVYPVDTIAGIVKAREALHPNGMDSAVVYDGRPDGTYWPTDERLYAGAPR